MFKKYGVVEPTFISYNQISLDVDLLERLAPSLLVLDEGQKLKNKATAAWSRRVARYLSAHPECKVLVSTGSVMSKSVLDYAHLLVWALRGRAPCPRSQAAWPRLQLDVERDPSAWLATLRACPGVFLESAPSYTGKLVITEHWPEPLLEDHYARAEAGTAPDGWALTDGWEQDECLKQLACGFYMRREPRPSPALLDARRAWAKCVENARLHGLADTELGARAVYPGGYAQWQHALASEPEATTVVEWLAEPYMPSPFLPGTLIFVHHVALGQRLSEITGWPYFRQGALDARGTRLDETNAPVAIASLAACSEGLNCQHNFHHLVYLEPPSDPRVWNQSLARVCRQGQQAPEVTCEIIVAAPIFGKALDAARRGAYKIQAETGQIQLLCEAEKQGGAL
jgi:hypothetical protein